MQEEANRDILLIKTLRQLSIRKNIGPRKKPRKKPAWGLEDFPVTPAEGKSRFHDYPIPLQVMRAIADQKFQYCTPIQEKALENVLAGKDLVGKANTGTGKTAVFLIAIFSRLLAEKKSGKGNVRALVLAPTRELANQIAKEGAVFAKYCNLSCGQSTEEWIIRNRWIPAK